MSATTKQYESCAETAKRIRKALKGRWPAVKFSVRSSVYSGGASVRIGWTDGPRSQEVDTVAQMYAGASFDGMIDLKSYHSSIVVDEQGLREVYFGADFVFCNRDVTDFDARKAVMLAEIHRLCKVEHGRFGYNHVDDLANGCARDYGEDETPEQTIRRVVFRETTR